MTRICFPLVRYTLNTPIPLTDRPKLKNLACTENRGDPGKSLIANGSSKDSSTSRGVKELSHSKGALFQSNSIVGLIVIQTPMQCNYIVFTRGVPACQPHFHSRQRKMATAEISVAIFLRANVFG